MATSEHDDADSDQLEENVRRLLEHARELGDQYARETIVQHGVALSRSSWEEVRPPQAPEMERKRAAGSK